MATENTEARIREARLIVARPEQVLVELDKYGDELKKSAFGGGDEDLEKSLLARGEPLIDLGLARYAGDKEVVAALYQKSLAAPAGHLQERYLRGLRIACLSNEVVKYLLSQFPQNTLGEKEFVRLITEGDEEDLYALLANRNLADEVLKDLYNNAGLFATLPDERRRRLVLLSIKNPRLITNEDSYHGPDLGYRGIHKAIISMLASVPTTEYWLIALRELLNQLDPGDLDSPDEPITSILKRWAQVPVSKDGTFRKGYYTDLPMRDEFRCLVAAMYGRHFKDRKFTILGSPDAADVVLRCAYYGKAQLTEKEMKDGFARDEDVYLLAVLCNDSVYHKSPLRKLLEDEQLRGDLRYVYQRRCEQIHKRRPSFDPRPASEWLIEESPPESKELTMLKQLETTLASIAKAIKSLNRLGSFGGCLLLGR
ncbi:MAG: hypothetical protein M3436_14830 [Pseudomonadota bacterium]|nr:hypothetical protein [Pseudomonadota bacterium]